MTEQPQNIRSDSEEQYVFADGHVNPPLPRLDNGEVDLNEFARQARDGERRDVMTISEAIEQAMASGSLEAIHMVNPAVHPEAEPLKIDLDAIRRELGIKAVE